MWILHMYVSFWKNLESITCLRGRLPNLDFAYIAKVWQHLDSLTCLLASLKMLVLLMYVRFGRILTLLLVYLEV